MFTFCKIIVENANKNFDFSSKNIDKKKKKWYNKRDGEIYFPSFLHKKHHRDTIPQSAVWLTAPFTQGSLNATSLQNEFFLRCKQTQKASLVQREVARRSLDGGIVLCLDFWLLNRKAVKGNAKR